MQTQVVSLETIENFLAEKRLAMIGVSRQPKHFSVLLFEDLCRRGYEVIPVNPKMDKIQGHRCFARVQDIQPPVAAALLMTSPEITDAVVADCAEAGVQKIWMYRAGGSGAVSPKAIEFCNERGIEVVPGQCPLMFLPGGSSFHHLHGLIRKLTGRYPRRSHRATAA